LLFCLQPAARLLSFPLSVCSAPICLLANSFFPAGYSPVPQQEGPFPCSSFLPSPPKPTTRLLLRSVLFSGCCLFTWGHWRVKFISLTFLGTFTAKLWFTVTSPLEIQKNSRSSRSDFFSVALVALLFFFFPPPHQVGLLQGFFSPCSGDFLTGGGILSASPFLVLRYYGKVFCRCSFPIG